MQLRLYRKEAVSRTLTVPRSRASWLRPARLPAADVVALPAVFVHCWGRVGRTGLVVGCRLQEHGQTLDDTLAELRRKWSTVDKSSRKAESPETPLQVDWVKAWPQRRRSVQQLMLRDRYRGALLGLAVGDVLGTTLEFKAPGTLSNQSQT
jgi:hypothetical protein